jgi:alkylhydroperoxidase/carboxymuconolactone decarboxylase family protein YurZ
MASQLAEQNVVPWVQHNLAPAANMVPYCWQRHVSLFLQCRAVPSHDDPRGRVVYCRRFQEMHDLYEEPQPLRLLPAGLRVAVSIGVEIAAMEDPRVCSEDDRRRNYQIIETLMQIITAVKDRKLAEEEQRAVALLQTNPYSGWQADRHYGVENGQLMGKFYQLRWASSHDRSV